MKPKSNKNVIISFDGIGMSTSWGKNCIKSAKMDNFNNLWQGFPHILVENKGGFLSDLDQIVFSEEGKEHIEVLRSEISAQKIQDNVTFEQIVLTAKEKHSSVHLIVHINEYDFTYQKELLNSFLKNSGLNISSSVCVIIIYDSKFDPDVLKITLLDFERIVNSNKAFLSCVASQDSVNTDIEISRFISQLTKSSNDGYFSLTQYFSRSKNKIDIVKLINDYSKMVPLSDFDQILVLNTETASNSLAKSLNALSVTSVFPKFIKIYTLSGDSFFEGTGIQSIVNMEKKDLVDTLISGGHKVGIICDQNDSKLYQRYKSISAVYPMRNDKIFEDSLRYISNGDADIIIISISASREIVTESFDETVSWLRKFDEFLSKIIISLDEGISVILFSPSAFLDNVNIDLITRRIIPSINQKMPFIIANKSYPKINKTDIFTELISNNNVASLENIIPSISKYMGISGNNLAPGKSVLNKMR